MRLSAGISKPPSLPKLPSQNLIPSQKIAFHILMHRAYPKALPKLNKTVLTSLPAIMR